MYISFKMKQGRRCTLAGRSTSDSGCLSYFTGYPAQVERRIGQMILSIRAFDYWETDTELLWQRRVRRSGLREGAANKSVQATAKGVLRRRGLYCLWRVDYVQTQSCKPLSST